MKRLATGLLLLALLVVATPKPAQAAHIDWHDDFSARKDADLTALHAKRVWSEEDVRRVIVYACYDQAVPHSRWLEDTIVRIVWRESRFDTKAANQSSSARGLGQFLAPWGAEHLRLDGEWSIYRIVRVYKDGGEKKLRQHWAATIGG